MVAERAARLQLFVFRWQRALCSTFSHPLDRVRRAGTNTTKIKFRDRPARTAFPERLNG